MIRFEVKTVDDIAYRLEECVNTMERLPGDRHMGYQSYWPDLVQAHKTESEVGITKLVATPDQITRMEETLTWFDCLNPGQRTLVWLRAYRVPWREISRRTGFPRTSAQRYWERALLEIAQNLQGEKKTA